jgi:pilus assembly protein CpaF
MGHLAHANSTQHLLWRLETMAMLSGVELPAAHIRQQVASAIDVVVNLPASAMVVR